MTYLPILKYPLINSGPNWYSALLSQKIAVCRFPRLGRGPVTGSLINNKYPEYLVYINIGINIIRFEAIARLLHHNSVVMSVVGKWEYNMSERPMQAVDNGLSSSLKISIPKHRKYSNYL